MGTMHDPRGRYAAYTARLADGVLAQPGHTLPARGRAVERRHCLPGRRKLTLIRLVSRGRRPDVVKTLLYRPEFFGRPMCEWTQAVMRGPSTWSVGERELFAAFTSRLNQCVF